MARGASPSRPTTTFSDRLRAEEARTAVLTIRRVYVYALTLLGLALLSGGVANLIQVIIDVATSAPVVGSGPGGPDVRDAVARNGAATLIGLLVWGAHWQWIRHLASSGTDERRSTLRAVFLSLVLALSALIGLSALHDMLHASFQAIGLGAGATTANAMLRPIPYVAIAALVWVAHWRVTERDRTVAGEAGGTATLRRWYVYGLAFIGVALLLAAVHGLVSALWAALVQVPAATSAALATASASTLVALLLWVGHAYVLPRQLPESVRAADRSATLHSLYLFGGSAVGIVGALSGGSQILYYALGRALGIQPAFGQFSDLGAALAGPLSTAVVYELGWAYFRLALREHAGAFAEARGAIGVTRLYRYLVALLALGVAATGLGGLLWALGDLAAGAGANASDGVRDRIALFATMILVAGPVWPLHWRAQPVDDGERRSLARRLYVYLSVIGGVLDLVASGALLLYRLFGLALGGTTRAEIAVDVAHALALGLVGALVAGYHGRALRQDSRRAPAPEPVGAGPEETRPVAMAMAVATLRVTAADAERLEAAVRTLRAMDVEVTLVPTADA